MCMCVTWLGPRPPATPQNVTTLNTAFMGMAANNLDGLYDLLVNDTMHQLFQTTTVKVCVLGAVCVRGGG